MINHDFYINALEQSFSPPPNHSSIAYMIPIVLLKHVKRLYSNAGIKIRIRYRGSRKQSVGRVMKTINGGSYTRSKSQANQDCLISDAKYFSIYRR